MELTESDYDVAMSIRSSLKMGRLLVQYRKHQFPTEDQVESANQLVPALDRIEEILDELLVYPGPLCPVCGTPVHPEPSTQETK